MSDLVGNPEDRFCGDAAQFITKTSPCNEDPLTPHFYIVKGIHYFLDFALKHRFWVLVRTALLRRF